MKDRVTTPVTFQKMYVGYVLWNLAETSSEELFGSGVGPLLNHAGPYLRLPHPSRFSPGGTSDIAILSLEPVRSSTS